VFIILQNEDLKMNKKCLRANAKNLRNTLNMPEISIEVCQKIIDWEIFQKSQTILAYYPHKNEIDLRVLFEIKNKKFALPRVDDDFLNMTIHNYSSGHVLYPSKYGVLEPSKNDALTELSDIDLVLIPALMVDKKGHRLGYGAGFYDRFLGKLSPNCIKAVSVLDDLFVENLPSDKWDIPVDYVITQNGILKI
jgi:5-formyltetrahydrofolate cyclo-ligase